MLKISDEPEEVLEQTMCALGECKFTFPSDRTMAEVMMADFEWKILQSMEQAELARNVDILTIDPKLIARTASLRLSRRHSKHLDLQVESVAMNEVV